MSGPHAQATPSPRARTHRSRVQTILPLHPDPGADRWETSLGGLERPAGMLRLLGHAWSHPCWQALPGAAVAVRRGRSAA